MGINDNKIYDIPSRDIICGRLLGRGVFEVWSGKWKTRGSDVAIKKVHIIYH